MSEFVFFLNSFGNQENLPKKSFIVRRSFVSGHVEWLVKEFVVGHIVADDHLVRFRSLAPSVQNIPAVEKGHKKME